MKKIIASFIVGIVVALMIPQAMAAGVLRVFVDRTERAVTSITVNGRVYLDAIEVTNALGGTISQSTDGNLHIVSEIERLKAYGAPVLWVNPANSPYTLPQIAEASKRMTGVVVTARDYAFLNTQSDFTAWANLQLTTDKYIAMGWVYRIDKPNQSMGSQTQGATIPQADCSAVKASVDQSRAKALSDAKADFASRNMLHSSAFRLKEQEINQHWDNVLVGYGCK